MTKRLHGILAIWDGTNLSEIKEIAGDRFLGVEDELVVVRNFADRVSHVRQGWAIARYPNAVADGDDGFVVYGERFNALLESEPAG